jgi:L-rhamnose mutarotase
VVPEPTAPGTPEPTVSDVTIQGEPAPAYEPESVVPELESEPAPEPFMPGQPSYRQPTAEEWYRQQYAAAADQLQRQQYELQQYQLAGLSEEEQAIEYARMERAQIQQQLDAMQQQEAVRQWREYCTQFLPETEADQVTHMEDPIRMLHYTNSNMQARLRQLEQENRALKAATATTQPAPPVTTGGPGAPSRRTLADLSDDEFEVLHRKALQGHLTDEDIPRV